MPGSKGRERRLSREAQEFLPEKRRNQTVAGWPIKENAGREVPEEISETPKGFSSGWRFLDISWRRVLQLL